MERSRDRLAARPSAATGTEPSEWAPGRSLVARVADGLGRRAARLAARANGTSSGDAAERALSWLGRTIGHGAAVDQTSLVDRCPSLLASAAAVVAELGETGAAREWFDRALACQRADGAITEQDQTAASLFGTAQFIRAGLAIDGSRAAHQASGADSELARACFYLASRIDAEGCVLPEPESNGLVDRWALPIARLACLAPLAAAARRWGILHWSREVERAAGRALREVVLAPWTTPTLLWAHAVIALVELGRETAAREIVRYLDCAQRPDGAVATHIGARRYSTWAAALAAVAWYSVDSRERGDRTMAWLAGRQARDGWFAGAGHSRGESQGQDAPAEVPLPMLWTAVHYLTAAQAQVRAAFADADHSLPRSIDRRDGRYRQLRGWIDQLGAAPRVLDAGCGTGRYLARLREELPQARLIGVDGSRALLAHLPSDVESRQGDLLRLPAGDGECDAAFMIEALEHALLPRRAIDELCRVVRPGGQILVIDKCRRRQALSRHEPWERWFEADEVGAWLAAHCDDVDVARIAHGAHLEPSGLFLCWTARRKAADADTVRHAA